MNPDLLDKPASQGVEEQRLTLDKVTWEQYETLRDTLENYPGLRITYLEGALELFMPSPEHENIKKTIARLIELYSVETNTRLYGYGSTTYRKKAEARGLEPDECYCVGEVKEFPDFAIEVIVTSGNIDKLDVYQGLGISEVWFWENDQLSLYHLRGEKYESIIKSEFLPSLDINLLVHCANIPDQYDAVLEFRKAIG